MYDYRQAMKDDITDYILNNYDLSDYETYDEALDAIEDDLWVEDCITGNGGMFYDTEEKCLQYVGNNLKLLFEAADAYEWSIDQIKDKNNPAQHCDCLIRCYLLGECLNKVLHDMWEGEENEESESN